MTTTLSRPVNADPDVWAHPDQWQPGEPLYRPSTAQRWQRSASLIDIKPDVPHLEDCTGTDCLRLDDAPFCWEAHPASDNVGLIRTLYGAEVAGPGTEFFGAVIGPK